MRFGQISCVGFQSVLIDGHVEFTKVNDPEEPSGWLDDLRISQFEESLKGRLVKWLGINAVQTKREQWEIHAKVN